MLIAVEKVLVDQLTSALIAQQKESAEVKQVIQGLAKRADDNELLTPEQACDYLGGIHMNTLLNYRREGLDHFKKGKAVWFRRGDLNEWVSRGLVKRRAHS